MTDDRAPANAGILVPPPFIFAAGYLLGWVLHRYFLPLAFAPGEAAPPGLRLAGEVLIILGAIFALWAVLTFRRARTSLLPFRPASTLVVEGPYRWSRNPMYLGLTAIYVGAALATNMVWPLLVLPLTVYALQVLVVRREEIYLERVFGERYIEYRSTVRRWL